MQDETPSTERLDKIVRRHSSEFNLPDSLVYILREMVPRLVEADFAASVGLPDGGLGPGELTVIRWDRETMRGQEGDLLEHLKATRSMKTEMDLFLDDLTDEFLMRGKRRHLPANQRRLLVLLLTRVGKYWEYADLAKSVWGDEVAPSGRLHNLLHKLHSSTGNLLRNYIAAKLGMERYHIHPDLGKHVKYAAIFVTGTYSEDRSFLRR